MPNSYWQEVNFLQKADFTIIGAGFTGLFSAIFLKEKYPELKVRVLESGPYPNGASARNAGFACFGSPSELLDDIESEGEDAALARLSKRAKGLKLIEEVCGANTVDYQINDGFEVFTLQEKDLYKKCLQALDALNTKASKQLGYSPFSVEPKNKVGWSNIEGLIRIKGEGTLDTGKLLNRLIELARQKSVELQFNSELVSYERSDKCYQLETTTSTLTTSSLIFATNAYSKRFFPDLKITPGRGQVLLTEPIADLKLKGSYHLERGYYYLRAVNNRILLGGGRHLDYQGETTLDEGLNPLIQNELENLLQRLFPHLNLKIARRWSGIMAFGPANEKQPLIRKVEDNLWLACRLGGMGIAMAPLVAKELSESIEI